MITLTRTRALLFALILPALLLAACGGGDGDAAADGGVASLDDGATTASESAAAEPDASAEEEVLEYVECLRGEGIDVPDPEVDADGNLGMRMRAGGPGGGDGEGITPEDFQAAREVCGDPPQLGGGMADPEHRAEFEDAALAFAQCMRDRGYDMPDPEFQGEGGVQFRGGPGLDDDDPEMQAAAEECQQEAFGNLEINRDTRAGSGGNGS